MITGRGGIFTFSPPIVTLRTPIMAKLARPPITAAANNYKALPLNRTIARDSL